MMYIGVATMLMPADDGSELGVIYNNRLALVTFGCFFFASGLTLFIGKVVKRNKTTGHGLFMIYISFLFGFIISTLESDWNSASTNLVASLIVGALYLRWKYHIYYYDTVDKRRKMHYSENITE